jgi:C4-dicarboxylate transporter DctM subunit
LSHNDWIVAIIGFLMLVHMLIGLPLFIVLALGTLAMVVATATYSLTIVGEVPFNSLNNWALLAMPLFVLTGDIISSGRIARQLVRLGQAAIGWVTGGLGMATIMGCFFFAGTSGSNTADTVAIGRIMIPPMVERRYDKAYAAALAAAGGCLGIVVPPSLIFIIYGAFTSTSVGDLFIAGVLPGALMAAAMCVANYVVCKTSTWGARDREAFSLRTLGVAFWEARYGLGAPGVILGGIYSGVFTPTEAAAVAVAYCLLVELFLTRGVKFAEVSSLLVRSGRIAGIIGPVIAFSVMFAEVLAVLHIPERIAASMMSMTSGYVFVLLMVVFVLLVVGCFLETIAALIIIVPILMPVAHDLGVNPVHFGVLIVCALTVGFLTPPVGINLFAASAISGVPYLRIALRSWPLLVALTVAVVAIAFVPWLSIWFM